ncbi:putative reverse transcriptase domain-containing protein, partial [Tanacetum coccineum]
NSSLEAQVAKLKKASLVPVDIFIFKDMVRLVDAQGEMLDNIETQIRYHLGKANVVDDALSRKERINPLRVRALMMTIHNDLLKQIRDA